MAERFDVPEEIFVPGDEAKFWRRRMPSDRPAHFATAEEMYPELVAAFDWLHNHPFKEEQLFHHKGQVTRTYVTRPRAFTWEGVALYLGMSGYVLAQYRKRPEFIDLMNWAESVIRTQKFELAAVNIFNPNFIARDLGMSEKQEVTGKDGEPLAVGIDISSLRAEAERLGIDVNALGLPSGDDDDAAGS